MNPAARLKQAGRTIRAKVAHVAKGVPYHVLNSRRGVVSLHEDVRYVDLDVLITKDGIGVNTHWQRPLRHGFYDPRGTIPKNTKVSDLTWKEVDRLRTRQGQYAINTVHTMRAHAKRRDVTPLWELKPDRRWNFARTHQKIFRPGEFVMAIGVPGRWRYFEAAKKAGLNTIILPRGHVPADMWPFVDISKSRVRRGPARVTWLRPRGRK